MNVKRRLAVSGGLMAALLLTLAVLWTGFNMMLLPVNSSDENKTVLVSIPPGADTGQIGRILAGEGVIHNAYAFRIYARLMGLDKEFIAGQYELSPASDLKEIMEKITGGEVYLDTEWFTIPEGFTVEQMAESLSGQQLLDGCRFLEIASNPPESMIEQFPFVKDAVGGGGYVLEGYLFPDTYQINRGASEEEIICLMLSRMNRIIDQRFEQRARELGMTPYQITTLASIVEKEAVAAGERKRIASVFYNRLADNYLLQSCATIQFILGETKPVLSTKDTLIESPYNTYLNPGLPPGPICSPGESSIKAVLYPEQSNYYYFVSKNDGSGEHYFGRTLEEHNQNIARAEQNKAHTSNPGQ
ncbi:MAG TPA: endolytic transglycosylase MltG [Firmicutes bacterium]|nr:endolytic transglycosylase MltG [Bacillota bacterium]